DDCLKALSRWDPNQYLNIWIVHNICKTDDGSTCDIKGYAYMAGAHGQDFDGLVMEAGHWGHTTEDQALAVAELGRYLNLFNTWNAEEGEECVNQNCLNDGDKVCDTPPDNFPGAVLCELGVRMNSCTEDLADTTANNPFTVDVEDMYENYMDGGEPGCRNTFTPGQKLRMRGVLISQRSSLLQSKGCEIPATDLAIKRLKAPGSITCNARPRPRLLIKNEGTRPILSFELEWDVDSLKQPDYIWEGTLAAGDSMELVLDQLLLTAGTHRMQCALVEINGIPSDDNSINNNRNWGFVYVPSTTPTITRFPFCTDMESGQMPQSWIQGNLDRLIGFDLMQEERCTQAAGDYVLRYNTMGAHVNTGLQAADGGTKDLLISPRLDLTPYAQAWLHFDVAYGGGPQGKQLGLHVQAVSSCQGEFETVYKKIGDSLATVPNGTPFNLIPWKPVDCGEWRHEVIDLTDFTGQELMLVFNTILESAFSQNLYLDNICVEVSFEAPCEAPDRIPNGVGTYTADALCTDMEGWTHYWKRASTAPVTNADVRLFSAKLGANPAAILPAKGVQVVLTGGYGTGGHDLSGAPYVSNPSGWHAAGRYYQLTPLQQPADSVEVQFYFNDKDLVDLDAAISPAVMGSPFDVMPYQIREGDMSPLNGHESITKNQFHEWRVGTSATGFTWKPDMGDEFYAAHFKTDGLWGGGIGTGGEGAAFGATYPAPLSDLRVRQIDETEIRLAWTTTKEWETSQFTIYRSVDRDTFEQIGTLDASGQRFEPTDYAFIDPLPFPELNYYFVALEHENGLTVVSDTVRVRLEQGWLVQVFPNPVIRQVNVSLNAEPLQKVEFGIYDGNWRLLFEATWIQEEDQVKELPLRELPIGLYFYAVKIDGIPIRVGKLIRGTE
ncbi:MAG: M43 family zinc metalloprotease, partial [Bacteroidota bacterium]